MTSSTSPKNPPTENLALIYQESLTSIVRLRCGRQAVSDAQFFRGQFRESLRLAQDASRQRGYNDEDSKDARFAVVAFLDESILNIRTAVFADWVRKPLQEELFGVHVGGEVFYQNLERLMTKQDSAVLADVLEVYLLCLLLGYQGRYSVSGKAEIRTFRDSLWQRIRRIRGDSGDLSPDWKPPVDQVPQQAADPWMRRLLITAVVCLVFACALYAFFFTSLHSGTSQVHAMSTTAGAAE
jgi:type VI secretion system protein ImpK